MRSLSVLVAYLLSVWGGLGSDCFPHNSASARGTINVHESASTNSAIVGTAQVGQSFNVSTSLQGNRWCWLKVNQGWIAVTNRVKYTVPAEDPPQDKGALLIEASPLYVPRIEDALELLEEKATSWHDWREYVNVIEMVRFEYRIEVNGNEADLKVSHPDNIVTISHRFMRESAKEIIAAGLIHEACHIHQNVRHGWRTRAQIIADTAADEKECYGVEARALRWLAPYNTYHLDRLRCLAREYNPFFSLDWIIKFVCGLG